MLLSRLSFFGLGLELGAHLLVNYLKLLRLEGFHEDAQKLLALTGLLLEIIFQIFYPLLFFDARLKGGLLVSESALLLSGKVLGLGDLVGVFILFYLLIAVLDVLFRLD